MSDYKLKIYSIIDTKASRVAKHAPSVLLLLKRQTTYPHLVWPSETTAYPTSDFDPLAVGEIRARSHHGTCTGLSKLHNFFQFRGWNIPANHAISVPEALQWIPSARQHACMEESKKIVQLNTFLHDGIYGLNRHRTNAHNVVKCFKSFLRPLFVKGAANVFLYASSSS